MFWIKKRENYRCKCGTICLVVSHDVFYLSLSLSLSHCGVCWLFFLVGINLYLEKDLVSSSDRIIFEHSHKVVSLLEAVSPNTPPAGAEGRGYPDASVGQSR
jgi:hypothetical protein